MAKLDAIADLHAQAVTRAYEHGVTIAMDADPLADIGVLADPDRITAVWARGQQVKGAVAA